MQIGSAYLRCPESRASPGGRKALAEAGEALGVSIGSGAVLVIGSVVTVGEARVLLGGHR